MRAALLIRHRFAELFLLGIEQAKLNAGERFAIRGLEFDVLEASPTRIERLLIRSGGISTVALLPSLA